MRAKIKSSMSDKNTQQLTHYLLNYSKTFTLFIHRSWIQNRHHCTGFGGVGGGEVT